MSIKKRFIILVILLATIPAILSTIICISSFKKNSIDMIEKQIMMAPKDESINLENFFKQVVKELNITGNMPRTIGLLQNSNNGIEFDKIKNDINILNEILNSRKNEDSFLTKVSLVDKNGIIISANNSDLIGNRPRLTDKELEKLKVNKKLITNIVSYEHDNEVEKNIMIAVPIFLDDKYQGYVDSIIDMSYFKDIVNKKSFFETGKAMILDSDGNVAASASEYINNSIEECEPLYQEWKKIKSSDNQNGIINYDINGTHKIGYYSKIKNTDWITLTSVEWSEFMTPLNKNNITIIAFLLLILVWIIGSYILLINYFCKPIYKLLKSINKIKQGDYSNRFIYNKSNEFGQISTAFNDLIDEVEKHKKEIERNNKKLQSLIRNIPGGVYNSRIEQGNYTLDFISDGCLKFLGYTEKEIKKKFLNNLIQLIYVKDRERVIHEFKEKINSVYNLNLESRINFNIEYRIMRKDESIIWVLDNGQIIKDKHGNILTYSVMTDITESKKAQKELKMSEERHSIIMSQTEDIIFEVNVNEDTIYYSDNWKNNFTYEPITRNFMKKIYKSENIYEEDKETIKELIEDIESGIEYKTVDIRIRVENQNYIWCRIRVTGIRNENNIVYKAIGTIIDIDKEKREAQSLLFKAQRDSLTNLYNKGITQQLIEEYIHNEGRNGNHTFFIIDIDDFKSINDNFGHLAGDTVLRDISSKISNIFRDYDIVGRIGGDEFIVFLKDINSEKVIYKKGDSLLQAFKEIFIEGNSNYKISGSIGIAKYPDHGTTFSELYANADKALYVSKNGGKDGYSLFNGGKDSKKV